MKHFDWETVVPAAKHDAVKKALQLAFGTLELDEITPLRGGRSPALVYKIAVQDKPYVLRLITETDALRDPARHFTAMNAAAGAGIAPPVRYVSVEDAVSIVDFMESTPITSVLATEEQLFGALATRIKEIHALPLFPPLVAFLDGVDSLIARYHTLGVLPASATEEHFRCYEAVQRVYPRYDKNLVSSHNDMNPTNILHHGGKLWIVDWEAAFANDCYLDLAVVNIFYGSGGLGEETLLRTYFGESLNEYHRARFFLMRQVGLFYVAMLFMSLVSGWSGLDATFDAGMETVSLHEFHCQLRSSQASIATPEDHLVYAKVLLNESLRQMRTARFREAVRLMESTSIC